MPLDWKPGRDALGQEVHQCRRDDGSLWFEIRQLRTGDYQVAYWREMLDVVGCCMTWTVDGTLAAAQALADEKARDGPE